MSPPIQIGGAQLPPSNSGRFRRSEAGVGGTRRASRHQGRPFIRLGGERLYAVVASKANEAVRSERESLQRMIALAPNDVQLRLRLAEELVRSGNCREALEQIRAVIRLDPNNLPARQLRLAADRLHPRGAEAENLGAG